MGLVAAKPCVLDAPSSKNSSVRIAVLKRSVQPQDPAAGEGVPLCIAYCPSASVLVLRTEGVFQIDCQRIHRLDRGYVAPGKTYIVGVMRLFRAGDDIACQPERVGRGEVNAAQKRWRAVVIVRIIPTGHQSTADAKRLENRIGKKAT